MTVIGNRLREQRIAKNITLKAVQNDTHLRAIVINALETDDFNYFHSFAQLRGFAKIYADYLGLESDEIVIDLKAAYDQIKPNPVVKNISLKENLPAAIETVPDEELIEYKRIYMQIASLFTQRRQKLGLTLQDIEWHSHIRANVLEKIEAGNLDDFGSPIQAKGMLTHYARFLELDTETIETLFGEALLKKRNKSNQSLARSKAANKTPFRKKLGFFTWDVFVIGGVIVLSFGFLVWSVNRFLDQQDPLIPSTQTLSVSDVILQDDLIPEAISTVDLFPEISLTAPSTMEVPEEPIEEIPTQVARGFVNVTIVILEKAYLRVVVDGEEKINTRGIAGNVIEFNGDEEVQILTGSGSSIKVIYNGQDLGTLGQYGEPILRIFSPNGIVTPTPSITPSPTITLTPSITPRPTLTPRPSATLRPTSTIAP